MRERSYLEKIFSFLLFSTPIHPPTRTRTILGTLEFHPTIKHPSHRLFVLIFSTFRFLFLLLFLFLFLFLLYRLYTHTHTLIVNSQSLQQHSSSTQASFLPVVSIPSFEREFSHYILYIHTITTSSSSLFNRIDNSLYLSFNTSPTNSHCGRHTETRPLHIHYIAILHRLLSSPPEITTSFFRSLSPDLFAASTPLIGEGRRVQHKITEPLHDQYLIANRAN